MSADRVAALVDQVREAAELKRKLRIVGGDSKPFFGRRVPAVDTIDVSSLSGIVDYAPRELVLTARAGTTLAEIETTLDAEGQMLAFEPPRFGASATLGGTLACNLSGPRRPWSGSIRDAVLGVRLINGRGEHMRFGGKVMKNVAGFDVSRLQAGALGAFGVITEISLKVLPKPAHSLTLVQPCDATTAIERMNRLAALARPLTGAAWLDGRLYLRLGGAASAVSATQAQWGGDTLEDHEAFWLALREQTLPWFDSTLPLWRFSVKPTSAPAPLEAPWLIDWAGAQRWVLGDVARKWLERVAQDAGGHVTLYRRGDRASDVHHTLPEPLKAVHRRLKAAFDPHGIFNSGRLYSWL